MQVKELEIEDEYYMIKRDITVRQAAIVMRDKDVPDLVVIDEEERPLGVVTETALIRKILSDPTKNPDKVHVDSVLEIIDPIPSDTDILDAMKLLEERQTPLAPVVEEGKLIGVVTMHDILMGVNELVKED